MAPTLSFSSSGRHSSMRIFISRSGPTGEFWLLPTRRWLARGLRPGIASEIHPAFLRPPNSQAGSGEGRVCHGKRVLRCGCPDLGQLRFERWSPSASSWLKVNYLISPGKVFRKAQSPSQGLLSYRGCKQSIVTGGMRKSQESGECGSGEWREKKTGLKPATTKKRGESNRQGSQTQRRPNGKIK